MSDNCSPTACRRSIERALICPRPSAGVQRAYSLDDVLLSPAPAVAEPVQEQIPELVLITPLYREKSKEIAGAVKSSLTLPSVISHGTQKFRTTLLAVIDDAIDSGAQLSKPACSYFDTLAATLAEGSAMRAAWLRRDFTPTNFGGERDGMLRNHAGELLPVTVLLKNTHHCVRQRKFYSHLLAYARLKRRGRLEDDSLALLLDGDTTFTVDTVRSALAHLLTKASLAAVCARIKPLPRNAAVVLAQEAIYAVDQHLNKATERILGGTVLCCPGCFTLLRLRALLHEPPSTQNPRGRRLPDHDTVLNCYAQVPRKWTAAERVLQGEDRFLCTLLIARGWRLEMCNTAVVPTVTPKTWAEYATQQCRWISSTLVNQAALLAHPTLRLPPAFRAYIAIQLLGSLLAPLVTVLLLLQAALATIPGWLAVLLVLGPPLAFALVCCLAWADPDYSLAIVCRERQLAFLTGCCWLYTALSAGVFVMLLLQLIGAAVANVWSLSSALFAAIAFIYTATCLMHGDRVVLKLPVLLVTLAPIQVFIPIYTLANFHGANWGTREGGSAVAWASFWRLIYDGLLRRAEISPPFAAPQLVPHRQNDEEAGTDRLEEAHANTVRSSADTLAAAIEERARLLPLRLAIAEAKELSASRRRAQRTVIGVLLVTWLGVVLLLYGFSHMLQATAAERQSSRASESLEHAPNSTGSPEAALWQRFPRTVGRLTLSPGQVPAYALMSLWVTVLIVSFVCATLARCGSACACMKRRV